MAQLYGAVTCDKEGKAKKCMVVIKLLCEQSVGIDNILLVDSNA